MTTDIRETAQANSVPAAPTRTASVISFEKLTVSYDNKIALNNLSSTIFAGEIVAVMGRNGAGKSSLLKAIAGVSRPQAGTVRLLEIDPFELHGKKRRERVGFIPQEPSDLLYGQSVRIECEQADRDNELPAGTTQAVLAQLVPGISLNTHPRDLSEGQRLGLALSVVLSSNPAVLILDEPTRGLDYEAKNELTRMLITFASTFGKAVLLATHDVELVAELANRVIFVADGDIVADGSTLDVLLSSPAFAPQVAKVMSPQPWLSVKDVVAAIETMQ
jgi:energy-coupling factor transport system ATP-binding protein